MLKIVTMAFSTESAQTKVRRPDTVGSTRGMVWQLAGLFGHQRFKNCSDWRWRDETRFIGMTGVRGF